MAVGFIILRHVNSQQTNRYWIHCYECIRKYHAENKILIIDDNSNDSFITTPALYNTTVIKSEYPKRGELLPYYYYLHHRLFDTAVILHDSVFINQSIDWNVTNFKFMWEFEHHWDQIDDETRMIDTIGNAELKSFYENKSLWKGCFGGMSIITYEYLVRLNEKYDLSKLLDCVLNRYNRCSFERIIACLLLINDQQNRPLLGNIHKYCRWGIEFDDVDKHTDLPLIKIWTGR